MSTSTWDSLTHSRSLDLPALPRAKSYAVLRILPPHSPNSLVRDPRGPARLLRIREDNLDNTLSDEAVVHFDVLGPRVEHWVPSQIDITHVVAVKGSWILDGYAQILENPLEPYGFTCGYYRAPVFRLGAR